MKAPSKRCVFSAFLNVSRSCCLRLSGSWFHKVGAATLKDLSANVLSLVLSINSKSLCLANLKPVLLLYWGDQFLNVLRTSFVDTLMCKYQDFVGYALADWEPMKIS